jgi:hypothetical protein
VGVRKPEQSGFKGEEEDSKWRQVIKTALCRFAINGSLIFSMVLIGSIFAPLFMTDILITSYILTLNSPRTS